MEYIRRHRGAAVILSAVAVALFVFLGWQRQVTMSQSVYDTLGDPPRAEEEKKAEFYQNQLTVKEHDVFLFLQEQIDQLKGGILTLPHAINGREYQRIVTALEYEGGNDFYGFVDIPMTEEDCYVLQNDKNIFRITDDTITQVVLFLSCAEGIRLPGKFDEQGKMLNREEIERPLSVNDGEKEIQISSRREETERILEEILLQIPKTSGERSTVESFLKWLDTNMQPAETPAGADIELKDMGDMLEKVYAFNHLAALTEKKASVLGYAKILSELCRRAGMESHVVMGSWQSKWAAQEQYVLCAVRIDGQMIYLDASGQKVGVLGNKRWLSEKEAKTRMKFVEYFEYK